MRPIPATLLSLILCLGATGAEAEPMTLDVVLSPKDNLRLDFKNNEQHFLDLTQREGVAAGDGVFADARVVDYGMNDVTVGDGGRASGYLEATTPGATPPISTGSSGPFSSPGRTATRP